MSLGDFFPEVRVSRGGIQFPRPGTLEWDRLQADYREREAIEALVQRRVGDYATARARAIDNACYEAWGRGWDVHVQTHWASRFVGIELDYRDNDRAFPTVHEHPDGSRRWAWTEDDE